MYIRKHIERMVAVNKHIVNGILSKYLSLGFGFFWEWGGRFVGVVFVLFILERKPSFSDSIRTSSMSQ